MFIRAIKISLTIFLKDQSFISSIFNMVVDFLLYFFCENNGIYPVN